MIIKKSTYLHHYKHIALLCALCLFAVASIAQNKDNIYLEHSETLSFDKKQNANCQVLRGNVVFRHDKAYMYCDSAYFYDQNNAIDAFSNIRMQQGDTLFVYGDKMHYDGNTKMARLKGHVRMINRETTLETDSLDFDRVQNVGYYYTGGRIYDKENVLTSIWGEYSPTTKMSVFKDKVRLVNKKFGLGSDNLKYNTLSKIAYIIGPSLILYEKNTTIYTENGWYNTLTEKSQLLKKSYVEQNDGKKLVGDTIYYDKKIGEGIALSHVQLIDTAQKVTVYGKHGYYREKDKFGVVRDSAYAIEYSNLKDTLFLHADTLRTQADSTYNKVRAIGNVRFFRSDLQGKCDTLLYSTRDSILNMYTSPVLWADSAQVAGEIIQVYQKDKSPSMVWVKGWAMAITQEDSIRFNQLAGKSLKAYIKDKHLYKIEVEGNAETIYYPREKDGNLIGINRAECSKLVVYLKDRKINKIVMSPSSSGTLYPDNQMPEDKKHLAAFAWQDDIRPKNRKDIFTRYALPDKSKKNKKKKK